MQADQKQKAVDLEHSAPPRAKGSSSQAKHRCDVQRARRRDAKKRRQQKASEAAASSSSWHPRRVPSGAKVYRRRIPPSVVEFSFPELPQESTGDPRRFSSELGIGIPILSSSSSWHPRRVPSGAKVYRRRIPPLVVEFSSPELPQESTGDPRRFSSELGIVIPILSGLASDPISFPIPISDPSDSSRRDLLPLSVLMAQYEKQFPL